jgi:hypothetical protein
MNKILNVALFGLALMAAKEGAERRGYLGNIGSLIPAAKVLQLPGNWSTKDTGLLAPGTNTRGTIEKGLGYLGGATGIREAVRNVDYGAALGNIRGGLYCLGGPGVITSNVKDQYKRMLKDGYKRTGQDIKHGWNHIKRYFR